jgi:hypothetical protein
MAVDPEIGPGPVVSLRAGGRTFPLARGEAARRLATQAQRWSYVLRARQRWADSAEARARHEQDAERTLLALGLAPADLDAIAQAPQAIVHAAYADETGSWPARIFPWEYVISAATRRRRAGGDPPFVVLRELFPAHPAPAGPTAPTLLYVQSTPGRLREGWDFDDELARVHRALAGAGRLEVLRDPSLEDLARAVVSLRPAIVHLSGFDNVQGLRELRELAGAQTLVDVPAGLVELQHEDDLERGYSACTLGSLLRDGRVQQDGFFLTSPAGRPCIVPALHLATRLRAALDAGEAPAAAPLLVGVSVANSAPRTAALLVGEGAARAAVGFQGEIDNTLADYFFELLYGQAMRSGGDIAGAFGAAWARARLEPNARRATGIALWASWTLDAEPAPGAAAATPLRSGGAPQLHAQAAQELNYAVLHNTRQGLFTKFVVDRNGAVAGDRLGVEVELQLGMETARYSNTLLVQPQDDRWNLTDEIHVPLTAGLVRSVRESVNSSVTVQLTHNGTLLARQSQRIRLLPVDQWRDNARDGQWLPSFVLPRDPAVMRAVQQAQRYVRVLRDDPMAGFEGYQVLSGARGEQELMEVDLQVQALWATLLHDWQLGYLNPPPTYSASLDSQRLRTPGTVRRNQAGTCIDLALLLAACLELVDIYPVVFLLEGHALPGYWRDSSFREDFLQAAFREHDDAGSREAAEGSSADVQKFPWQTLGAEAHAEVAARIRSRELVPIETVRLTENCSFVEAIEAGIEALAHAPDFHSLLDIVHARENGVTPLPIAEDTP